MDALTAMHARRSRPVLTDPAPGDEDLRAMLAAAVAAPDHGRHRPWRFVMIRGAARKAFGEVLAEALRRSGRQRGAEPDAAAEDRERAKPMRAPVIIAVACAAGGDEKVPHAERLAATAAATENLVLAATALGYGAMWRTGAPARDAFVREALGFADGEEITGFVYLGTVPDGQELPPAHRELDPLVREWP